MEHADLVDAVHYVTHLGDCRPCKLLVVVEGFKPALQLNWFYLVCDFLAPAFGEVVADNVFGDGLGVLGLRANGIRAEV
jgi:hypothetical protein